MKKILLVGEFLDVNSVAVAYAARIAQTEAAEVECLFLLPSTITMADLIEMQEPSEMERLLELRGRATTAEWVQTRERLVRQITERSERAKLKLQKYFGDLGITFSCRAVTFEPHMLLPELERLMPVSLIVAGKLRFPSEFADHGVVTVADLGVRFRCPTIDADAMQQSLRPLSPKVWRRLVLYGLCSVLAYFVFFPRVGDLNTFYMNGGLAAALAIMATVAAVAWVYGSTIECLLKLIRMDKRR